MRCAADIDDVGCPEPAAVVQRMLSTASCAAKLVPELCPIVHVRLRSVVVSSTGGQPTAGRAEPCLVACRGVRS